MKIYIYATKRNLDVLLDAVRRSIHTTGHTLVNNPEEADIILAAGGDGTILRSFRFGKPVLPVNFGTVGHISNIEPRGLENALQSLATKNYRIERYPTIGLVTDETTYYAVNDVVIKSTNGKNAIVEVSSDAFFWYVRGDGVIFSTPLGSTAYNKAAGGPIVDIDANVIIITPLASMGHEVPTVMAAPHTFNVKIKRNAKIFIDGVKLKDHVRDFTIDYPASYVEVVRMFDSFKMKHIGTK